MNGRRLNTIRQRMHDSGINSFLISHPPNIRYLTGYTGDNAIAVVNREGLFLFVYRLNRELADETAFGGVTVVTIDTTIAAHFSSLDTSFWGATTGYEPEAITCSTFYKLDEALDGITLKSTTGIIEECRQTKDEYELDAIIKAQSITDLVFGEVLGILREGVIERDIAAEIEYRFRLAGGERAAFETIVAFGPKSSMPHAIPDTTALKAGDIVLFDMGTVVNGYASDMTRSVVFGHANDEVRSTYHLVLEAHKAGIESLCAGNNCVDAHRAALKVFETHGVADAFLHSLGHGVGLEVHEAPVISPRSTDTFREHAVVTVEPGLYFPGKFGIRIEDMLVITENGARNLTKTPNTLIEL